MVTIKVNETLVGILAGLHLFASVGQAKSISLNRDMPTNTGEGIEAKLLTPLYISRIGTTEVILGGGLYSTDGSNKPNLEAYFRICDGKQLGSNPYIIALPDGKVLVDPQLSGDRLEFNISEIDLQKAIANAPPCPSQNLH